MAPAQAARVDTSTKVAPISSRSTRSSPRRGLDVSQIPGRNFHAATTSIHHAAAIDKAEIGSVEAMREQGPRRRLSRQVRERKERRHLTDRHLADDIVVLVVHRWALQSNPRLGSRHVASPPSLRAVSRGRFARAHRGQIAAERPAALTSVNSRRGIIGRRRSRSADGAFSRSRKQRG